MTIASVGTIGTGAIAGSPSTFLFLTTTATVTASNYVFVAVSSDNLGTTDGDHSDVTAVTDGKGSTYVKLGEYTNSPTGAAADGVTSSLWMGQMGGVNMNSGDSITVQFASSVTDAVASAWQFSVGAGKSLALVSGPVTTEVNATNGFGSAAISGLASAARLYFRACAKEVNDATAMTASTSFTAITNARSRNNSLAVAVQGEFRINTSTGETSNPTWGKTGDTASVFGAVAEISTYSPLTADQGSFTLTGEDAALVAARALTADQASFALTGQAATLARAYLLPAASATFTLTGEDAGLLAAHALPATQASFALTGQSATLALTRLLTASQASFALTGEDASLFGRFLVTADTAEFFLTGQDANLLYGTVHTLAADYGTFTLTGEDAVLLTTRALQAAFGDFALAGIDAGLVRSLLLQPDFGQFTLSAYDAAFMAARLLTADEGAFALSGFDVVFDYARIYASEIRFVVPAVANLFTVEPAQNKFAVSPVDNTFTSQ
jgi:hypothetical protein